MLKDQVGNVSKLAKGKTGLGHTFRLYTEFHFLTLPHPS